MAGVVSRVGLSGEMDVFDLIRPRDERDLCAGIRPPLHGAFDQGIEGKFDLRAHVCLAVAQILSGG